MLQDVCPAERQTWQVMHSPKLECPSLRAYTYKSSTQGRAGQHMAPAGWPPLQHKGLLMSTTALMQTLSCRPLLDSTLRP